MKKGKDIMELALELKRQAEGKRDFVLDTRSLSMTGEGQLEMKANETELTVDVTPNAHGQIANRIGIPMPY
jgi:hypothetical protein